jgi:hypothetical protein
VPETPYWLDEEFCQEHGRRNAAEMSRMFGDAGPSTWRGRREKMHGFSESAGHPEWCPLLDRAGRPFAATATAPEAADVVTDSAERFENVDEINEDGSIRRTRLLPLAPEDLASPDRLLAAHGFDPELWTLERAVNKAWNLGSRNRAWEHSVKTGEPVGDLDAHIVSELYASTVTVKPKVAEVTPEDIAAALAIVKPIRIDAPARGEMLLELGIVDAHFGNSSLQLYRPTLGRILAKIRSQKWDRIIVPVGSDFFHADNFKNTTSNGTPQSSVDWTAAFADGTEFICTIIEAALANAVTVYVYYMIGNHDESMTWMFCQGLAWKYPQAVFDLDIAERKVSRWHDVAVGMTHGDSATRKDLDRVFVAEFPEFASAPVREVHLGHKHHEMALDQFGVMMRSLSTATRADKWHREEGFVGACKRFMLFEYEPDALTDIRYV